MPLRRCRSEIDAVGFSGRAKSAHEVSVGTGGRSGLLAGKTEVADERRVRRIAQIVDLRHPFVRQADAPR